MLELSDQVFDLSGQPLMVAIEYEVDEEDLLVISYYVYYCNLSIMPCVLTGILGFLIGQISSMVIFFIRYIENICDAIPKN